MAVKVMGKGFDAKAWERHEKDGHFPFEVTYEGAVLQLRERNGYDDSDFYAVVWDEEHQCVTSTQYATTRGWTYPNSAQVDATDEVIAKARAWATERIYERAIRRDEAKAREVSKGRKVLVTKSKGGKYPVEKGTVGYVVGITSGFRSGPTYSSWAKPEDVAIIQVEGSRLVYIPVSRVEVIEPEQYETDKAMLREHAESTGARWDSWATFSEPAFWLDSLAS